MARILVVDDETAVRELVYDALTGKGHEVLAASSGPQLFELLKTQRADLILLDLSMPKTPGTELGKKLRTLEDEVPIVLLRGAADAEPTADDTECIQQKEVIAKEPAAAFVAAVERVAGQLGATTKANGLKGTGVRATILTIDDDPAARSMVKLIFEGQGLRVIQAESGEAGLKTLEQEQPHAVLLDLTMPGMDGLMTLKKIKGKYPQLPVIMVSARGEQETVREAMRAGAYDYVTKPFSLDYLESTVLTKLLIGIGGDKK